MKKINECYKGYNIYSYSNTGIDIGKLIINKKFDTVKKLKDTKRNYVAIIEIDRKKYVLKEPRNEYRIPQRKIMSLFKKGEAVTTLDNVNKLINDGFLEFVKPILAITKRKNGTIIYSMLVMEFYDGIVNIENNKKLVELVKKMHNNNIYHGDFNPGNFLSKDNEIKIIDTQAKKMSFGRYRAHYDMLTMKNDSFNDMEYPYEKDIWYCLAFVMKKIKRLKIIEYIKMKKKEMRDKGWKI